MESYQSALCADASWRRSIGLSVTDQDQPDEMFCLFPPRPELPPLLLVGGMGPLAGAAAFRQACARFRNSRVIVLYQACSVPDRSTVILGEGRTDTPLSRGVAIKLAAAVRLAAELAAPASQVARCIVACNSAHYFWRSLVDDLQQTTAQVRMISLVESSIEALQLHTCTRALLLTTEGARAGKVFSTPCRDAGIAFDEPSPALSLLAMSTIYEGVKAMDERRALVLGNELFETVLRSRRHYDCILAGCSELPLAIDLLRYRGSPAVAAFLSRVKIVDPLEEALCHA